MERTQFMAQERLLADVKDHVGTLTFHRPEKRNSLTLEMLAGLHRVLEEWARGSDVRCVVITGGEGKAFSSGYDISAIPTESSPEMEALLKSRNPVEMAFRTLKNFPYPTVAAWNGYCFGAALNLSVCCDVRVAVDDAKFGMPPARLGVVYHADGLQQFINALGMAVTREIFMTAQTYTAVQAMEMGIVSRLYPRDIFFKEVYALARTIAGNAPIALKNNKAILNMLEAGTGLTPEQRTEAENLQAEGFASEDLKEGQMAFLEKRKPVFQGR